MSFSLAFFLNEMHHDTSSGTIFATHQNENRENYLNLMLFYSFLRETSVHPGFGEVIFSFVFVKTIIAIITHRYIFP